MSECVCVYRLSPRCECLTVSVKVGTEKEKRGEIAFGLSERAAPTPHCPNTHLYTYTYTHTHQQRICCNTIHTHTHTQAPNGDISLIHNKRVSLFFSSPLSYFSLVGGWVNNLIRPKYEIFVFLFLR